MEPVPMDSKFWSGHKWLKNEFLVWYEWDQTTEIQIKVWSQADIKWKSMKIKS